MIMTVGVDMLYAHSHLCLGAVQLNARMAIVNAAWHAA